MKIYDVLLCIFFVVLINSILTEDEILIHCNHIMNVFIPLHSLYLHRIFGLYVLFVIPLNSLAEDYVSTVLLLTFELFRTEQ